MSVRVQWDEKLIKEWAALVSFRVRRFAVEKINLYVLWVSFFRVMDAGPVFHEFMHLFIRPYSLIIKGNTD